MKFWFYCMTGLLLSGVATAQGQTAADGQARAKALAALVDERTIGIARVELTRIDFDQFLKHAAELAPGSEKLLAPAVEKTRPEVKRLIDLGAKDFYLLISLADLQRPVRVFSFKDGADVQALHEAVRPQPSEVVERVNNMLALGDKRMVEQIKAQTQRTWARPELARAFAAAGDSPLQLLLLPTADNRRVIEELLPELPAEVGGGSSKVLSRGVMWAAAAIDLAPQPQFKLVIQSQDPAAAAALRDKWLAVLKLIGGNPRVAKASPQFANAADHLAPTIKGDRLNLAVDARGPAARLLSELVANSVAAAQAKASASETRRNLMQIGLAFQNYYDVHKSFPAAASYDANGKPLLSWRVHILPSLDQRKLYDEFHLDEPWDSEHNRQLIERMPAVFRSSNLSPDAPGKTCFVGVASEDKAAAGRGNAPGAKQGKLEPGTVFQGREGAKFQGIIDGTSNTILVIESDPQHAVVWTQPDDLPFDPARPTTGFGFDSDGGVGAVFCDGHWARLKQSLDPETWRRLLLRNDGQQVSTD